MLVLLCDDQDEAPHDAIERISQQRIKDGGDAVEVAGHAQTARAAFKSVARTKFDIVLIDLCLPIKVQTEHPAPPSGPWLARAIRRAHPKLQAPLVMWTNNVASTLDYRNECRAFAHHGGAHIIDKVAPAGHQLRTLEAVLDGERWQPPADDLTEPERKVLAYYAEGRSTAAIAKSIDRSHQGVEVLITAIREKLLGVPAPPGTAKGFGPVLAAAQKRGDISWLPVAHLAEPAGVFAEIDKG